MEDLNRWKAAREKAKTRQADLEAQMVHRQRAVISLFCNVTYCVVDPDGSHARPSGFGRGALLITGVDQEERS